MQITKLKYYAYLMRLDKPVGILLLLWPTLWALWLASDGKPNLLILAVFVMGVVLMRSAGCVINDFADRRIDGKVRRTQHRPLATAKVSVKEAMVLFGLLSLCAFGLVCLLNSYTITLSIIGLVLTVVYPFMKRFTHLPQCGLGVAFSWGVPMAFAAETQIVPWSAWLVFLTAAIWPVIYDTLYAITDREDDLSIGVKSTAVLFAENDRWLIGLLQIGFMLGLVSIGLVFHLQIGYFFCLFLVGILFCYQQYLIQDRDPQMAFKAFLNNQWVGLIIFLGIVWSKMT